jgi:hypothetical protein
MLAVTIRALHVNGKQMTLAVFRQLPIRKEQEDSVLWGTVRYGIKDEGDLWLVFSHEGKLFRRALDLSVPPLTHSLSNSMKRRLEETEQQLLDTRRRFPSWQAQITTLEEQCETLKQHLPKRAQEEFATYEAQRQRFNRDSQLAELTQLFIAV